MMISMVDIDGDGQVSYDEFRRLVIDPDPARADFGTTPLKSEAKEAAGVTQARYVSAVAFSTSSKYQHIIKCRKCGNSISGTWY